MDFNTLLALLPRLMRIYPLIQGEMKKGVSINTVVTLIKDQDIQEAFKFIGTQMFPSATPAQATTAAIVSTYDLDYTKAVQSAMNKLVSPSPSLTVDGHYGALTKAAVTKFQQAHSLVVDGWAGVNTMAKVKAELAKS